MSSLPRQHFRCETVNETTHHYHQSIQPRPNLQKFDDASHHENS